MNPSLDFLSRRGFLGRSAGSLGLLALEHLLSRRQLLAEGAVTPAHRRPKAKAVISLFQHG